MRKRFLMVAALSFSPLANSQADLPTKEVTCRACHGAAGAAPIVSTYPKLNGQNKDYLVSALKAYRAGERKGGLAMVMATQATQLSDDEIEALAAYYASQQ